MSSFAVTIQQWENFQFLIDFNQDGVTDLLTDEPEPVGQGRGPDPARLLAAAIGNCLASSLLFCLRKAKIDVNGIKCIVEGDVGRNAEGRLRVQHVRVKLTPAVPSADFGRINQCVQVFENYCTISESVRAGINIQVEVEPASDATAGLLA